MLPSNVSINRSNSDKTTIKVFQQFNDNYHSKSCNCTIFSSVYHQDMQNLVNRISPKIRINQVCRLDQICLN